MRAPATARPEREPPTADARILEIATSELRTHGLRRTTVVSIAAAAGMSHANVYRYFSSKDALIDAVTAAWLRPVEAQIRVIAEGPDPAKDKLERLLLTLHRAYRDKLERDPEIFSILIDGTRENSAQVRRHRARLQQDVTGILQEGFAQASFQGDLRQALALTFDVCHRFLNPVSIALDADAPRGIVEARAARTTRLLLRGLATARL